MGRQANDDGETRTGDGWLMVLEQRRGLGLGRVYLVFVQQRRLPHGQVLVGRTGVFEERTQREQRQEEHGPYSDLPLILKHIAYSNTIVLGFVK